MPWAHVTIDRGPSPARATGMVLVGLVGASVATTCFGRALAHDGGAPAFAAAAAVATWAIASAILAHGPRGLDRQGCWGATLGLALAFVGVPAVLCSVVPHRDVAGPALCAIWSLGPSVGTLLAAAQHTIPLHDPRRLDARDAVLARGGSLLAIVSALGVVLAPSLPLSLAQAALALLAAATVGVAIDHDWGRWRRLGRLERGTDHDYAMRAIEPHEHPELPRWVGATDDAAPTVVEQRALGDGGPFRETTIATPRFRLPGGVLHARDVIARRTAFSGAAIALATAILLAGARCN